MRALELLDVTLGSPAENLALDEALLDAAEARAREAPGETPHEVLRFWESPQPFVVLGSAGRLREEVDLDRCRTDGVSVLRRHSGGGAVLQGPGCLNFSLVLSLVARPSLARFRRSYAEILSRTCDALAVEGLEPRGTSDLAVHAMKVSGNAQRRRRFTLLHHGTFLYDFDVQAIARYLAEPERRPDYRGSRRHEEFLANLPLGAAEIKARLAAAWGAAARLRFRLPSVAALVRDKYSNPAWTERF